MNVYYLKYPNNRVGCDTSYASGKNTGKLKTLENNIKNKGVQEVNKYINLFNENPQFKHLNIDILTEVIVLLSKHRDNPPDNQLKVNNVELILSTIINSALNTVSEPKTHELIITIRYISTFYRYLKYAQELLKFNKIKVSDEELEALPLTMRDKNV